MAIADEPDAWALSESIKAKYASARRGHDPAPRRERQICRSSTGCGALHGTCALVFASAVAADEARAGRDKVAAVKRSVTVQIAGLRYSLKTDGDDRTVKALAAHVDGKIRDIQKQGKVPDTQAVAVLAALQIAEELFAERREASELRKRIREKSQSLLDYLEREARV
jgi:cell division protein ZapA (FtsZ GTPase activity inhibitor)